MGRLIDAETFERSVGILWKNIIFQRMKLRNICNIRTNQLTMLMIRGYLKGIIRTTD